MNIQKINLLMELAYKNRVIGKHTERPILSYGYKWKRYNFGTCTGAPDAVW